MNKYQRLVIVVTLIDALVMLLLPPFSNTSLARQSLPSFEGYYPLLTQWGHKPVNVDLLTIQMLVLASNLLAAYLCLRSDDDDEIPQINFTLGIGAFSAVNLGVMLLFPPFETYRTLLREAAPTFDSFYFIWGERSNRPIFVPLLYLEVVFLAINMLALWLLFNTLKRSDDVIRAHLLQLAETMDERELAKLTDEMRRRVEAHHTEITLSRLGRGNDRRTASDPDFHGTERRHGPRRTH